MLNLHCQNRKNSNSRPPRTWALQLVKKKTWTTRRLAGTPAKMWRQRWWNIRTALTKQHKAWSWTFWTLATSRLVSTTSKAHFFQNHMVVWLIILGIVLWWASRWHKRCLRLLSCLQGDLEELVIFFEHDRSARRYKTQMYILSPDLYRQKQMRTSSRS